jgi:hypothetical protein
MTDFYSTKTICYCIQCSLEDFVELQNVLEAERQRLTDEEDLELCLEIQYFDGELFICAESLYEYSPSENVSSVLERLLSLSDQEFVEIGYPQSASRIRSRFHEGGRVSLTYNDGTTFWMEMIDQAEGHYSLTT